MTRVVQVTFMSKPSPAQATERSGGMDVSCLTKVHRGIMGWNRLIGVRWLCGMSNERLAC